MLNKWLCPYCKIRIFWNPRPHWTCQRPVTCPMDQTLNTLDEMDSVLEVSLSVWPELWHPELFKGAAYTVLYTTPPWGVSITFHPCIFGYSPPSSCSTFCFILLQSRNQYLRNEKCVCVRLLWHGFKHLVCFLIISTCFLLIHTSSVNLQVAVQALPHPSPAGTSHNSQSLYLSWTTTTWQRGPAGVLVLDTTFFSFWLNISFSFSCCDFFMTMKV